MVRDGSLLRSQVLLHDDGLNMRACVRFGGQLIGTQIRAGDDVIEEFGRSQHESNTTMGDREKCRWCC